MGMSSSVTMCPFRNRASLVTPFTIWVISWHRTCPTASTVRTVFISSCLSRRKAPSLRAKALYFRKCNAFKKNKRSCFHHSIVSKAGKVFFKNLVHCLASLAAKGLVSGQKVLPLRRQLRMAPACAAAALFIMVMPTSSSDFLVIFHALE